MKKRQDTATKASFIEKSVTPIQSKLKESSTSVEISMKSRWLILLVVVLLALSLAAFGQAKNSKPRPEKARDPVCGIMVEKDPKLTADYNGKTYYFCSNTDRDKFKKNPQKYVKDK